MARTMEPGGFIETIVKAALDVGVGIFCVFVACVWTFYELKRRREREEKKRREGQEKD
jgi:hypothetical protein